MGYSTPQQISVKPPSFQLPTKRPLDCSFQFPSTAPPIFPTENQKRDNALPSNSPSKCPSNSPTNSTTKSPTISPTNFPVEQSIDKLKYVKGGGYLSLSLSFASLFPRPNPRRTVHRKIKKCKRRWLPLSLSLFRLLISASNSPTNSPTNSPAYYKGEK